MTQAYEMLKDVATKELVEQERVSRFEDLVSRLSLSDDEQDALEVMETKESWEASYHADPKPLQTNGIHLKQWVGGCPFLHAIQLDCWLSCDRVWACPVLSASWDVTVAFVEWPFRECPQWTRTYSTWLHSGNHSDFRRNCCLVWQVFASSCLDYPYSICFMFLQKARPATFCHVSSLTWRWSIKCVSCFDLGALEARLGKMASAISWVPYSSIWWHHGGISWVATLLIDIATLHDSETFKNCMNDDSHWVIPQNQHPPAQPHLATLL